MNNNTKIITIQNYKFQIEKINAKDASYLFTKVFPVLAGFFDKKSEDNDFDLQKISKSLSSFSKEDWDIIQTTCLMHTKHLTDSGQVPLLNEFNSFINNEIAYNLTIVMGIIVQSLIFNFADFFLGGMSEIYQPVAAK